FAGNSLTWDWNQRDLLLRIRHGQLRTALPITPLQRFPLRRSNPPRWPFRAGRKDQALVMLTVNNLSQPGRLIVRQCRGPLLQRRRSRNVGLFRFLGRTKINTRENEKSRRRSQPQTEAEPINTKPFWPDHLAPASPAIRQHPLDARHQRWRRLNRSQFLQLTFEFLVHCG